MSSSRPEYSSSYRANDSVEAGDDRKYSESSRDRDSYRSSRDSRERSLSRERSRYRSLRVILPVATVIVIAMVIADVMIDILHLVVVVAQPQS